MTKEQYMIEAIRKFDMYAYSENQDWYDIYGLFPVNPELVEECERLNITNETDYLKELQDRLISDAQYIDVYLNRYHTIRSVQ